MKNDQNEEMIYNPFNEHNKEISYKSLQSILNHFRI